MARLQLLTGARPGEIRLLRPCDITFGTDGVWSFRPHRHKTQHRGKDRIVFIGPLGQVVLRPFLDEESEAYCFSPARSEDLRSTERRRDRKTPVQPSQTFHLGPSSCLRIRWSPILLVLNDACQNGVNQGDFNDIASPLETHCSLRLLFAIFRFACAGQCRKTERLVHRHR